MSKLLSGAAVFVLLALPAAAQDAIKEGRSVSTCSSTLLVCAFAPDGRATATSECKAKQAGAVRILPGDCDDPD